MAEKKRSRALDYVVYLAVRILVCVIQSLSFEKAAAFARLLAWAVYHVNKRHRLVAIDNLRQAFPGQYEEPQLDAMVRNVYRHFCMMLIEIMHMPRRFHLHNYRQHVVLHEPKLLAELFLSERPKLFVTGHFGNWEMAGYTIGLLGFPTHTPSPGRSTIRTWINSCAASANEPGKSCWPSTAISIRSRRRSRRAACWPRLPIRMPASAAYSSISSAGPPRPTRRSR